MVQGSSPTQWVLYYLMIHGPRILLGLANHTAPHASLHEAPVGRMVHHPDRSLPHQLLGYHHHHRYSSTQKKVCRSGVGNVSFILLFKTLFLTGGPSATSGCDGAASTDSTLVPLSTWHFFLKFTKSCMFLHDLDIKRHHIWPVWHDFGQAAWNHMYIQFMDYTNHGWPQTRLYKHIPWI